MTEIRAKPLEWDESPEYPLSRGKREWTDKRLGFHIEFDPEEPEGEQYIACFGEGDSGQFETLELAKEWCQSEVDNFIRENATIVV